VAVAYTNSGEASEDGYDEELAYVTEVQTMSAAGKSGQKALDLCDVLLDSVASVSIFNNAALLTNIVPAYKSVYIGGVNKSGSAMIADRVRDFALLNQ
jgi:hypothetical protein